MKPALSTRQAQIAEGVANGLTNKQIAANLGISPRTVDEHIRSAAERLQGNGYPRLRLALWFVAISKGDE